MARAGFSQRQETGTLYVAQRLGESGGKVSNNQIIRELREKGFSFGGKQTLNNEINAIKGHSAKPSPGAIKGGKISGVMRSKSAKQLGPDAKGKLKTSARRMLESGIRDGHRKDISMIPAPGNSSLFSIQTSFTEEDMLELDEGEEIPADESLADGLDRDEAIAFFNALDDMYDSLGL